MTWDVTGLSYDSKSFTPTKLGNGIQAFCLDENGTRLYINQSPGWSEIDQHILSTPWDISTAGPSIGTHSMQTPVHCNCHPGCLWMGKQGNRLFSLNNNTGTNNGEIYQMDLAVGYDITSVSGTTVFDVSAQVGTFVFAMHGSEDGKHFYAVETNVGGPFDGATIHQWDMATPYEVSTAAYASKSFDPSAQTATPGHIIIGNLGTTLLVADLTTVYQYDLTTAFDISTAVYTGDSYNLEADVTDAPRMDIHVDPCSLKLYASTLIVPGIGDTVIHQWDMGTASGCASAGPAGPALTCTGTYVEGGVARLAIGSLSGLYWLGCTTVDAYLDGSVVELEVCDGLTTFPRLAARGHIGLGYITDIETLDIEIPGPSTRQGGRTKLTDVTVRFFKSRLPLIGPDFHNMVQMKQRDAEPYGEPTSLLTGDKTTNIPPDWNSHGRIAMRIKDPVPCTWLAVIPELEGEED